MIVLIACKRPPEGIVIELSSDKNITVSGTFVSDGTTKAISYTAPTNVVLSGVGLAVHLALKETNGSCEIQWHPKSWEKYPRGFIEKYPSATLNQRKPYYHIAFSGSKWFSGASADENVPWPDKK
jgi:hypothetical protein